MCQRRADQRETRIMKITAIKGMLERGMGYVDESQIGVGPFWAIQVTGGGGTMDDKALNQFFIELLAQMQVQPLNAEQCTAHYRAFANRRKKPGLTLRRTHKLDTQPNVQELMQVLNGGVAV